MSKDKRRPPDDSKPLTSNPFAALKDKLEATPVAPSQSAPKPAELSRPAERAGPARAVLRIERKGRGGKDVTVVEKLELSAAELDRWLSELKRSLGTGGVIEGSNLVFQGDHRQRLEKLLTTRGVRKISSS